MVSHRGESGHAPTGDEVARRTLPLASRWCRGVLNLNEEATFSAWGRDESDAERLALERSHGADLVRDLYASYAFAKVEAFNAGYEASSNSGG